MGSASKLACMLRSIYDRSHLQNWRSRYHLFLLAFLFELCPWTVKEVLHKLPCWWNQECRPRAEFNAFGCCSSPCTACCMFYQLPDLQFQIHLPRHRSQSYVLVLCKAVEKLERCFWWLLQVSTDSSLAAWSNRRFASQRFLMTGVEEVTVRSYHSEVMKSCHHAGKLWSFSEKWSCSCSMLIEYVGLVSKFGGSASNIY